MLKRMGEEVGKKSALVFDILAECPVTKARVARMVLPHHIKFNI